MQNLRNNSLDMWSCFTFYFKSTQVINLRSSYCGRQGNTTTQFKANAYSYNCHWKYAMDKIFWVCFNAKGEAIICVILWNLWEFRTTSFYSNGCAILWKYLFKDWKRLTNPQDLINHTKVKYLKKYLEKKKTYDKSNG